MGYLFSFNLYFTGKKKGVIGITSKLSTHIRAESEEKARLKLYEEYEYYV